MANNRRERLMQEALDDQLDPMALQELYNQLDATPDADAEFSRLKSVDRLLRTAPLERAPHTLALRIMARLADGLQPEQLKQMSGLALAMGLTLMALLLLPLLAGLGWLIVTALSSATILADLMTQVVGLLSALMNGLDALVRGAQEMLAAYPEMPVVMMAIIPLSLWWLARIIRRGRETQS